MSLEFLYGNPFIDYQTTHDQYPSFWTQLTPSLNNDPPIIIVPTFQEKHLLTQRLLSMLPVPGFSGSLIQTRDAFLNDLGRHFHISQNTFSKLFQKDLVEILLHQANKDNLLKVFHTILDKKGLFRQLLSTIQSFENNLITPEDLDRITLSNPCFDDFKCIYQSYYQFIDNLTMPHPYIEHKSLRQRTTSIIRYNEIREALNQEVIDPQIIKSPIKQKKFPKRIYLYDWSFSLNFFEILRLLSQLIEVCIITPDKNKIPVNSSQDNGINFLKDIYVNKSFQEDLLQLPPTSPNYQTVSTPSWEDEIHCAASTIYKITQENIPLDDFAIFTMDPAKELSQIKNIFDSYGIPIQSNYKEPLNSSPLIYLIEQALDLILTFKQAKISPSKLFHFLESNYLKSYIDNKLPPTIQSFLKQSGWYNIARAIGRDFQLKELSSICSSLKKQIDTNSPFDSGDIDLFVESITFHQTYLQSKAFPSNLTLGKFWERLMNLLEHFQLSKPDNAKDTKILQVIREFRSPLADLETHLYKQPVSIYQCVSHFQDFIKDTEISLESNHSHWRGVSLFSYNTCLPRRYSYIFLLHLNEGNLPGVSQSFSFLSETEKLQLGHELGVHFPTNQERIQTQNLYFSRITNEYCTKQLFITYSEQNVDNQPIAPSTFLEKLKQTTSHIEHQSFVSSYVCSDIKSKPAELKHLDHLLQTTNVPRTAVLTDFTPAQLIQNVLRNRISVSSIERYVYCPYVLLAEKGYQLTPYEPGVLKPQIMGQIIHDLFDQLYKDKNFTIALKESSNKAIEIMRTTLTTILSQVKENMLWDSSFINDLLKNNIIPKCTQAIHLEHENLQKFPTEYKHLTEHQFNGFLKIDIQQEEISFISMAGESKTGGSKNEGSKLDFPIIDLPITEKELSDLFIVDSDGKISSLNIPFTGRIDRIDIDDTAKRFIIVDYKDSSSQKNSIGKKSYLTGEKFQMSLYLKALQAEILKNYEFIAAFYFHLEDCQKKYGLFLSPFNGQYFELSNRLGSALKDRDVLQNILKENDRQLIIILQKTMQGQFNPNPQNSFQCGFCQYKSLCRYSYQTEVISFHEPLSKETGTKS